MNTNSLIATSIISPILAYILPIDDASIRISISMIITNIVLQYYEYILSFFRINASYNYVIIDSNNQIYTQLLEIINMSFIKSIKTCELKQSIGKNVYHIKELNKPIKILFENNEIYLKIDVPDKDNNCKIIFYSKSHCDMIKKYLDILIDTKQTKTQVNTVVTWKLRAIFNENGKFKKADWISKETKINKTFENTFYSDTIMKDFFNCIKIFIESEDKYNKKGINYKKTFLLHGEPGCGKTSAIKLMAAMHNIPIFITDIDTWNSRQFIDNINDIEMHIAKNSKFIILFEDFDRTRFINRNEDHGVFLNFLDGVDNTDGRIIIMTANDLTPFNKINGLTRPGRVDHIVKFTPCDNTLITKTLKFRYECNDITVSSDANITQCKLSQLIDTHNNVDDVIKNLPITKVNNNKIVVLKTIEINKIIIWNFSVDNFRDTYDWISEELDIYHTSNNTFYSDAINNNFFQCIQKFIGSENKLKNRGMNFKKTFLLHGDSGCGKTLAIKLASLICNIPIFNIELDKYKNLDKVMNKIKSKVTKNYIVLFENIDKSATINKYTTSKLELQNIMFNDMNTTDGRITIITANDITFLNKMDNFVGSGRIDHVIEFTPCDNKLATKILQHHFDNDVVIPFEVNIKHCELIKLIETYDNVDNILANIKKKC